MVSREREAALLSLWWSETGEDSQEWRDELGGWPWWRAGTGAIAPAFINCAWTFSREMACNTDSASRHRSWREVCNTTRAEDAGGRRGSDLPPLPIFLCPLPEGGQGGGDPSPPPADSSRAEEGAAPQSGPALHYSFRVLALLPAAIS